MNKCYLKEFQHFDGEEFITFNIYFLDKENNKIALKSKKDEENPWNKVGTEIKEGDVIDVTVLKMLPFGVFVDVIDGVEGFIHISQIATKRIAKPSDVLEINQVIKAKIVKIDLEAKKVELSIRVLEEENNIDEQ